MMLLIIVNSELNLELPSEEEVFYLIDMRDETMVRHALEPLMLKYLSKVLL